MPDTKCALRQGPLLRSILQVKYKGAIRLSRFPFKVGSTRFPPLMDNKKIDKTRYFSFFFSRFKTQNENENFLPPILCVRIIERIILLIGARIDFSERP